MATAAASNGAVATPQPIFLSGSHHREVCFGQEVVPAPAMLAELRQRRKIAEEKAARKAKGLDVKSGAGRSSTRKTGNVSVKELIDSGLLKPGKGTVTVTYKGTIYRASLLETGQIDFKGQIYDAPGAFSMFAKRLMTPAKAGDDGWRSVHVDGFSLEEYKQRYLSQKAADEAKAAAAAAAPAEGADGAAAGAEGGSKPSSDGGAAPADGKVKEEKIVVPEPPPSIYMTQLPPDDLPPLPSAFDLNIPGETDGAELEEEAGDDEPDTSNWVQCSRCSAWRVVPDEFWPDIDAAGEEDWFCEEATWDLTQYDPFTMACKEFKK